MKFPPFFLLIALAIIAGISVRGWELWSRQQAAQFICHLVQDRAIIEPQLLKPWMKDCFKKAEEKSLFESREQFFTGWQNELDRLKVSHLRLYTPVEQNELWTGMSVHNGLQLEWVDGHATVIRIWPRSAAEEAGIKLGDRILVNNLDGIERNPGVYRVLSAENTRGGKARNVEAREVKLTPKTLQYSYPPMLHDLHGGIYRLEVNEFRTHGFSSGELKRLLKPLEKAKALILDLRWNRGGNLVAGLRLARFLTCQELDLGILLKKKGQKNDRRRQMQMPDSLKDEDQLRVFAEAKEVILKVRPENFCYNGPMVILVNFSTASVAEIITEGLRERPLTKILGGVTAGDALMGVWYDLEMFNDGSMISIPEATYQSRKGRKVEGVGVQPDKKLFWDMYLLERGYDSWLKDSQDFLLQNMMN